MIQWLRNLFAGKKRVRAKYDAAQTGPENRKHWGNADALGPREANNPGVRRTLRNRARYEVANNSLAGGLVRTYAADVIGTGPRLQMLTDNDELNQRIETEFRRWMQASNFASKLRTMCESKTVDGECFALFVTNQRLPLPGVALDLRLIEAEQVSHGTTAIKLNEVDGVRFDEIGNPTEYLLLSEHPGESGAFAQNVRAIPFDQMLHLFECSRPGTVRGIPEIMPALPLWAILRRYELATLGAAELVATMGAMLLKQNAEPNDEDLEAASAWSEVEVARNMLMALPAGTEAQQMKPEQPTTLFVGFWQQIAASAARCLSMPKNIALCDSTNYNYASGRLDHQTYYKQIDVQRGGWEINCLDRVFAAWILEAVKISGYLPIPTKTDPISGRKLPAIELPHEWYWDGSRHVDPEKEANAQQVRLANGMTTRAAEYAREGRDWEAEFKQLAKEQAKAEELGLTFGEQPAKPATQDTETEESEVNAKRHIAAAAQSHFKLASDSPVSIRAAEGAAAGAPKRFDMLAYTGGKMDLGWGLPVVVDLAGMKGLRGKKPILMDHNPSLRVGHSESAKVEANQLHVEGVISGASPAAQEVMASSLNGFPWQASIGASADKVVELAEGKSVTVNGQEVSGPCYIVRASALKEVSFVTLGADESTHAQVAAAAAIHSEENEMDFAKWLEARGLKEADLNPAQIKALKADWELSIKAAAKPAGNPPVEPPAPPALPDPTAEIRAKAATEIERQAGIAEICAAAPSTKVTVDINGVKNVVNLQAHAIKAGWTIEKTDLEMHKASRETGPPIHSHGGGNDSQPQILEAAACQAIGLSSQVLEKSYKPEILQAAHSAHKGRLSLQEMFLRCAHQNGYRGFNFKADPQAVVKAAWSSGDISGILSNIANKFLLETYMAVESTWRMICAIRPVSDFKQITSYRLTGNMLFEEVGNGGELKHGTVGQQSYNNQARTYGKMLALTRTDMINDDLGALAAAPRMLGRGSALKLNEVVWTAFMDNASFFAATHTVAGDTGNANYAEGSGTALSINSLTAAELLFLDQVDPNGNPLGVIPKFLLVPNALNVTATSLTRDLEIRDTTASTKATTGNPHAGKFTPVRSSYLSNAGISGYSTKKWYLLADPNDVPTIEVCFLNGQETPVIEQAEADFSVLGVQMRGFFDFGAAKQDYRGGVAMKGEA